MKLAIDPTRQDLQLCIYASNQQGVESLPNSPVFVPRKRLVPCYCFPGTSCKISDCLNVQIHRSEIVKCKVCSCIRSGATEAVMGRFVRIDVERESDDDIHALRDENQHPRSFVY